MKFNQLIFSILFVIFFSSCQNKTLNKKVETTPEGQLTNEIREDLKSQKEHPGKAVFTKNCMTCHLFDGTGISGKNPSLGKGSWAGIKPKKLIAIMMKGLSGKIEVNGEVYINFMPSNAKLSDEEIADVLSYVRSSFGNSFEPVTADMVKKIRSGR